MSYSPNQRSTIDQEVYKWVVSQKEKDKIVTANNIRQKAFELGQEFDPNFKASLNWYNNWKKRYDYTESPEAEALKHKKRHYTAAFKLHAVRRAAEMESASQAALELDVSRRCLQRWQEELEVISSVAEHSSSAIYRRPGQGRKVIDTNLDKGLLEWLQEQWKQGINVTTVSVREKAREMATNPSFKASLGWFMKWQKRHGVDLKEHTCNPTGGEAVSPLKLRLLQEGEVYTYSPGPPPTKRRKITKGKKLSYDDEALLENDEEFDRLLLTWLVERWEAGDIVNDRMVKEKAMELTSNAEFKASKSWLMAWKRKYNISLENQTYGNEGDEEQEEIVEESEVYDNEVLLEEQGGVQLQSSSAGGQQRQQRGDENPLTPTKEEAATALASLSAEDHEAAGLEIAEALQKLANAFGIGAGNGEAAKEAMAQLTAAYQADNGEFLLEGAGQVAVEEVVSEEVVTDEPMVVIETEDASTTTQTDTAPSISDSITITMTDAPPTTTTITSTVSDSGTASELTSEAPPTHVSTEDYHTIATSQPSTIVTSVANHGLTNFVSEEVVIDDPVIVTTSEEVTSSTAMEPEESVQVLVQDDVGEIVTMPATQEIVQEVGGDETTTLEAEDVSIETITPHPQELLDIVQETITGGGDETTPTSENAPPTDTTAES